MATKKKPHDQLLGQLSSHIELFREELTKLPKSITLPSLGTESLKILKKFFPENSFGFAFRSENDKTWENPAHHTGIDLKKVGALFDAKPVTHSRTAKDKQGVYLFQRLADTSVICLSIIPRKSGGVVPDQDIVSCRFFLQLCDSLYQESINRKNEKALMFSLNHRILQLNSLIDTGIEVAKLNQGESPHHLALVRAASLVNASRGVVKITSGETLKEEYAFPEGAATHGPVSMAKRIASSFRFFDDTFTFELYNKESRDGRADFEETDQLLLDALARQVHASLENRYLYQQSLEKQRIEQELDLASSIQKKILPAALPSIEGYDIAGVNIPSKSIGGDYYNCILLEDGTYALVVADVAGKGVPAALLVNSLHAYLLAYLKGTLHLPDLASHLDKSLYRDSTEDKFVTALIALLNPSTGEIEYLSAGHNPGYILRTSGDIQEMVVGGPPLGILNMDLHFESNHLKLEKGDRLLLYTDGVTEAHNGNNELFETAFPLPEYMMRHKPHHSGAFIDELIRDIKKFSGSAPQSDDITVLYLHRV